MLTNLLPGLRELRAPLAAGSLLLASLYILLSGFVESVIRGGRLSPSLQSLSELLGGRGWLVVGAVGAYLAGSVFMSLRSGFTRGLAVLMLPHVTSSRYLYGDKWTWWKSLFGPFSRPSLRRLGRVRGEEHDENLAREVATDVIFGGGKRLLVANKDLFGEYDRLQSEAEFRDAVTLPALIFVVIAVANMRASLLVTTTSIIAALTLAAIFFVQARSLDREAYSLHSHAIADGVVSTSTLEAFGHEPGGS